MTFIKVREYDFKRYRSGNITVGYFWIVGFFG